jgi:DNA-binding transcriptional LysR family regulator
MRLAYENRLVFMDLQRLRYFVAVAEERHITRAAARLGMAQPPLSQQIRRLETELKTRLFDRLPKGVALTAAGEVLLEDARALLEAADRAGHRARRVGAGAEGELVGGFTTSASLHPLVPRLLRAFHKAHPAISFDLHESNAAELTEAVLTQRLDFAIMRAPVARPPTLAFIGLGSESLLVALPANHHLPVRSGRNGIGKIAMSALADQGFILVRRRAAPGLYANIVEACRLSGFEPRVIAEVSRMLTNLNLVAAGIGVSCVPESMRQVGNHGVVYAALEAPAAARSLLRAPLTLMHRSNESRPTVLAFIIEARRLAATQSSKLR